MTCIPPWIPDMSCAPEWDTLDPALQERSTALAWSSVRYLTGGRVGACEVTYRPCVQNASECTPCSSWWLSGYLSLAPNGVYIDGKGPCGGHSCTCAPLSEVILPGHGIVTAVYIDGAELAQNAYRVDDHRRVVRADGGTWPSCQPMDHTDTETGTFSIHYVPGVDPGADGQWAVGILAWEFSKACTGAKCRLPSSVTTIARQGVTMALDNSMFSNRQTGIREVDAWVLSVNPNQMKVPSRAWSPDSPSGRYETPSSIFM